MRIYMLTDLEGVAGVASFESDTYPTGKYYEDAKRLLTLEVNAACDGLFAAGATDVLVADGHGPGAINYELLHDDARLIHGRPFVGWDQLDEATKDCDACMILGQHAMAGVRTGNLNHTMASRMYDYYMLNGKPIGEIAIFSLYQGAFGRPVFYLTGDRAACDEIESLIPGVQTTCVKEGLSRNCAISISAKAARSRIREGAGKALSDHMKSPVKPLVWDGPFVMDRRYFHTDAADAAARQPGVERVDAQTVRYRADDVRQVVYR